MVAAAVVVVVVVMVATKISVKVWAPAVPPNAPYVGAVTSKAPQVNAADQPLLKTSCRSSSALMHGCRVPAEDGACRQRRQYNGASSRVSAVPVVLCLPHTTLRLSSCFII